MSAIAEIVEPRMLLSTASLVQPASAAGTDATGTKELVIVAETYVNGYGTTQRLKIDEIRLVGDEIHVFSTSPSSHSWPGEYYPAYLELASSSAVSVAQESLASQTILPSFVSILRSDPVSVTVPDREWKVDHFFATIDQPQSDLYNLRTFRDSTLLYRRADADGDSGWLTNDVDPGAGSTVGLDFTPPPAAPQGLVSVPATVNSGNVTLYFDETPTSAFAGQRFVRRYEIHIETPGTWIPDTQFVAFDNAKFKSTDANGSSHSFGGTKSLMLSEGVYSWSVRVQDLPVFPDGATGNNALATPWSNWSATSRFTVLPQGEQILVGKLATDYATSIATIEWGPVDGAASYEVWINRLSDGKQILHKSGLSGFSYQTEPLDPDKYRVWVRATRADGTGTTWSKPKEFTVYARDRYINITSPDITHAATPVIEWDAIPQSTKYRITLIDSAKEQAAALMRFDSPESYNRFITAYSRTVAGSSSSHTVATALMPGKYRLELTVSFANRTTTQGTGQLEIEPAGVPMPDFGVHGIDSLRWHAEPGAVSYDVWVAYLHGVGEPTSVSPAAPSQWRFATADEVTTGSYLLPSDAPAGRYRIWLRPNRESGGQVTKGTWNTPVDFTSFRPLSRQLNVTVDGEHFAWEPMPRATGFRVTYDGANSWLGSSSNRTYDLPANFTATGIPTYETDGSYSVWVQWLDAYGNPHPSNPTAISIEHIGSPLTWKITNDANSISWDAVSYADLYIASLHDLKTGNELFYVREITPSTAIPDDLPAGHYRFQIRVIRIVNERSIISEWTNYDFDHGIQVPTNVRLDGNILKWDGQANAKYEVSIVVANGRMEVPDSLVIAFPVYRPYVPVAEAVRHTAVNAFDLSEFVQSVYSFEPTAILKLSVRAITADSIDVLTSQWSEPMEFTLPERPQWTDPIVEQKSRPAAPAPVLTSGRIDIGRIGIGIRIPFTIDGGTIVIGSPGGFDSSGVGGHVYRTDYGAAIDVEYVTRYQLRVTNLQTGEVQTIDESQVPELMQFKDEWEQNFPYRYGDVNYIRVAEFPAVNMSTVSLTKELGLQSGIYKFDVRVQYLPVVLSTSTSDPYTTLLTGPSHDRINVAATPWSDWSSPVEYTVLPDGQNVLPLSKSPTTINQRPTFAWGSNTANAQYELWVENRATKQRVLHETLSNLREFQSPTDLPAGQYDWWVRIVGSTGPRNGWSPKQSLEILAPAITTSVVAETVDATPVVSWSAASGAQSYAVTFTSTTTGNVAYQATEAAGTTSHRVTTILPNDTYSVSIQASLPNGARTAPGTVNAVGDFVLKRMTVGAAPKIVTISNFKVSWQAVDSATRYNVWINYIDSTGKTERILRQDALGTELPLSASLTQRPGAYRVWIRAIRSEAGQEYTGRWSEVKTLQVNAPAADSSALAIIMSELAITGVLDGSAST